ncbi:hypothetical protein [uncultured Marixanthomonas sp.]|uniref:hypothetical protein n=1 Tax=uncultured Marixanthomonas sp. TaxID=757245 RepID=UPI0030DA6189|tara:strand:+ start:1229 stop:1936 length:708 start_codon:yes stop_codon:yes gene_type:complete
MLQRKKDDNPIKEIGTETTFYLKLQPLIRLEIVIDLLDLAVNAALAVGTGGAAANPVARRLVNEIGEWLSDDDNPVSVDMYIELVLFGEIKTETEIVHHTKAPNKGEIKLDATVGIIFRAGLTIKAAFGAYGVEFYALGEATVKGEGSITFGHELKYNQAAGGSLNYLPKLLFDGIVVTATVKAEVGMTIRKSWFNFETNKKLADFEYEERLVAPFDILRKIAGRDVSVTLIENE